jgi:hypothetical protein
MVNTLRLLLPALFPSWRFFDVIAPSPRIELAVVADPDGAVPESDHVWRACRPTRPRMGIVDYVTAFFWNARWNETLFLATCAERLMQNPSEHSTREIRRRLRRDLTAEEAAAPCFRFRLVFVSRDAEAVRRDVAYVSPPYPTVDPLER